MSKKSNDPEPLWFVRKIHVKIDEDDVYHVYATSPIKKDEIFEVSPVITFHIDTRNLLRRVSNSSESHPLEAIMFHWKGDEVAMCWGYGGVYQSTTVDQANVSYRIREDIKALEFFAKEDIKTGQEICIYNDFHHTDVPHTIQLSPSML
jgi:SET domain-containing protein